MADNSGVNAKETISKLYAAHNEGKKNVGFDIDAESGEVKVGFIRNIRFLTNPYHIFDGSRIV